MEYIVTVRALKLPVTVEEKDISHLYRTQRLFLQQASVKCALCHMKIFKLGTSKHNAIEQLLKYLGIKGKFSIRQKQRGDGVYICDNCK